MLIKNAKVFNSYLKNFIPADVSVKDGKFYYIDRKKENVKGIWGILEMISATKDAPIDIFTGFPAAFFLQMKSLRQQEESLIVVP